MSRNTIKTQGDISSIYNIYQGRDAAPAKIVDFLTAIRSNLGLPNDRFNQLVNSMVGRADPSKTIGSIFSADSQGQYLTFDEEIQDRANFLSLGGTSAPAGVQGQTPQITDKLTILGQQDNSLEAFLKKTPTSSAGGNSAGGTSGGGSSAGGGRISGGGGSAGGGAYTGSAASGSLLGGSVATPSGPTPSAISDIVTQSVSEAETKASSNIYKKLKAASGPGRIDKVLTGQNLRQQTLLGK